MSKHTQADDYAKGLEEDYGFEKDCVLARFNCLLRFLQGIPSKRILEVGCGLELFIDAAIRSHVHFDEWVIIEPASALAERARARAASEHRLHVIEGYCEDPAVGDRLRQGGLFDIVILSGVLQDVPEPAHLLKTSLTHAAPQAHVLVTTPNALSFHRLLAVEMGQIPIPHALSARNKRFRQNVVFDHESLRSLLERSGLRNLRFDGYMFKPFTHVQMARALELLPDNVNEGLDRLGQRFPKYSAEIAFMGIKP
jgi:2-polyprenyl-3-methyl-5-hydroxy-6-metoxy-1,4-benzoquinol methylase